MKEEGMYRFFAFILVFSLLASAAIMDIGYATNSCYFRNECGPAANASTSIEFAVYKSTLTQDDITHLYNNGQGLNLSDQKNKEFIERIFYKLEDAANSRGGR